MNPYQYILPTTQQHQQFYFFMYHVLQNLAFLPTDLWGVGCGRRILPTGYEISQITDYQWSQHRVLPTSQRSTDGPASSGGVTPLSPPRLRGCGPRYYDLVFLLSTKVGSHQARIQTTAKYAFAEVRFHICDQMSIFA